MVKTLKIAISILLLSRMAVFAQDESVEINEILSKPIHLKGFTLDNDHEVKVNAVGTGLDKELKRIHNWQEDKHNLFAYAWILDARSRKVVWRMTIGNTKEDWWNKHNRVFESSVKLSKGEYELYYSAVEPSYFSFNGGFFSLEKVLDEVFGDQENWDEHAEQWKVVVDNVDNVFDEKAVLKYQKAVKNSAILSLTEVGEEKYINKGFTLKKPAKVRIYAIGEIYEGDSFDYGWIVNASTGTKVWEMNEHNTDYAGGAVKNRYIDDTIKLEAGDYLVYYKSDPSHNYNKWNANPPYDPNFWGITIYGADKDFDKNIVEEYSTTEGQQIVSLNRLGDYADVEEGLTLLQTTKLRIYAAGEGTDGEMFDYGWIVNVGTGNTVWKMQYSITEHAGGADKNRMYDGIVELKAGTYIVHFVTDDSHSYNDWNSDEPYDPEAWGIQIFTIGKKSTSEIVKKYEPEKDKNVIVKLVQVGDDEHVKKQFTLDRSSKIRIYAIGEGDWDEMYDYGWIEDFDTGETVWEMEYDKTRRAGGASKNRLFDDVIKLQAGNYIAHFVTDDSHAYKTWNLSPPRDRKNWGITIYLYNK